MALPSPTTRPEAYRRFERDVPHWYRTANLGIFVHWGAYSVPAWAEPTAELGTVDPVTWFAHNPYAEWYFNTIRIDGSPAQQHHRDVHGGRPYDDFLDAWTAQEFDADAMVDLFRRAGARYVVPTTKHHDGITLWDAAGTDGRTTVARGPKRDLVAEFAAATRAAGLRFGTYYSGGLDWHAAPTPPLTHDDFDAGLRPVDGEYDAYARAQVLDLVERHRPDVLWNDIDWPDAGKAPAGDTLEEIFDRYYAAVPHGVVNDRWGGTHWDYRTSEYEQGRDLEAAGPFEHCRGIGLSFGYNQAEGPEHSLDGPAVVRMLADVVSRGGNLLLNVGPDAQGRIPPLQQRCLEQVADWMAVHGDALQGTEPLDADRAEQFGAASAGHGPWVRWTRGEGALYAIVDAPAGTTLDLAVRRAVVPTSDVPGPAVLTFEE